MLFNSTEFLFYFFPIVLLGYFFLKNRSGQKYIYIWLTASSVFFYSYWNLYYSWLLVVSIVLNFIIGKNLNKKTKYRKSYLITGIIINLAAIGYYKYSAFILNSTFYLFNKEGSFEALLLPLGISFFTFQQITYLVDAYKGQAKDYSFFHYSTFVTFFPQLIAGPIVHHKEMMPQFERHNVENESFKKNVSIGISIFAIGCFKKVMIADQLSTIASPIFNSSLVESLDFLSAWIGALAYTFQLYFDFSGYSDMAIGIALMFGIVLPINFNSPYKSTSIIDFWRRWHITLSRFLREYIYFPLGGNRKGGRRRYVNLLTTMLIGGLWHGAGWTFVFWGLLHGVYLIINHFWHSLIGQSRNLDGLFYKLFSWTITFAVVVVGWVFFRAENFESALNMLSAMAYGNGLDLPKSIFIMPAELALVLNVNSINTGVLPLFIKALTVFVAAVIAVFGSNISDLFSNEMPELRCGGKSNQFSSNRFSWRPTKAWSMIIGVVLYLAVSSMMVQKSSEFLYFNF